MICTEVTCGRFFVALDVFMFLGTLSLFCHLFHGFRISTEKSHVSFVPDALVDWLDRKITTSRKP